MSRPRFCTSRVPCAVARVGLVMFSSAPMLRGSLDDVRSCVEPATVWVAVHPYLMRVDGLMPRLLLDDLPLMARPERRS